MANEQEKIAQILVECGYAVQIDFDKQPFIHEGEWHVFFSDGSIAVNPYADTLEGRRQADAIEDWLKDTSVYEVNHGGFQIWEKSKIENPRPAGMSQHQHRLDRIKWCIQELCK